MQTTGKGGVHDGVLAGLVGPNNVNTIVFVNGEIGVPNLVKSGVGDLGCVDQGFAAEKSWRVRCRLFRVKRRERCPNCPSRPLPAGPMRSHRPRLDGFGDHTVLALTETGAINNDDITDRTMMDARLTDFIFDAGIPRTSLISREFNHT